MPTTFVRDLGIYIDSDVSMRSQVTKTMIKRQCPYVGGLHDVVLLQPRLPSIQLGDVDAAATCKHQYVQIHHVNDNHWVVSETERTHKKFTVSSLTHSDDRLI